MKKRKLQRKKGTREALLKNLATSLILYEKVKTTLAKAKEVRPFVERLIERGKKDDLASRRYLLKFLPRYAALKILEDLAPSFSDRNSGYLRILKMEPRKGDGAKMAIISFVERPSEVRSDEGVKVEDNKKIGEKEKEKNEKGKSKS